MFFFFLFPSFFLDKVKFNRENLQLYEKRALENQPSESKSKPVQLESCIGADVKHIQVDLMDYLRRVLWIGLRTKTLESFQRGGGLYNLRTKRPLAHRGAGGQISSPFFFHRFAKFLQRQVQNLITPRRVVIKFLVYAQGEWVNSQLSKILSLLLARLMI